MESLVVFAKSPVAGRTKTRLAEAHGDVLSARLYTAFLEDLVPTVREWARRRAGVDPNRRLTIYCAPGIDDPALLEIVRRAGAHVAAQSEGDLGDKLRNAFEAEFERGARAVCAIGTDAPTLPVHLLDHAFRALLFERAVIGPSFDGGYWLVGAQRPGPDLFTDIPWSTPEVTRATLERLSAQGVTAKLLPFWYDVDVATDLDRLAWHVRYERERSAGAFGATWRVLRELGLEDAR